MARTAPHPISAAIALGAATLAALLALGPGIAPAHAACRHAEAHPHEVSLGKLRAAITCLVNHQRSQRGRHLMARNKRLQLAAQRHTNVMLAKDCFAHRCPGEPGLDRRVRRTGYLKGQAHWRFAEDLGYDNTPLQMVKAWLRSGFNRRNLLARDFRDLGVGVGWGAPRSGVDDSRFATYTIVFAWRRARR